MKKILKNGRIRRVISTLMIITLLFCTTVTDVNLFYGFIHIDLGSKAEAATGNIDDSRKLDSSVVPDANLLQYLKEQVVAADSSINMSDVTVGNLVSKVSGALVVPSTVRDITGLGWARNAASIDISQCASVTEISASEFENCNMTQVSLPASITKLNSNAFKSCKKLETINLSSITYFGDGAFSGCVKFNDTSAASIRTNLEYLGIGTFQDCISITQITVPVISGTTFAHCVPTKLFSNCSKLEKVKFADNSLKEIKDSAFEGTGELTFTTETVYGTTLPATVDYIGTSAFDNSLIKSLDLSGNKLTEISNNTFAKADLSEGIKLPEGLLKIGSGAFTASKLKGIVMPNSVTEIGRDCFREARALIDVVLSKNLKVIPNGAFQSAGFGGTVTSNSGIVWEGTGNLGNHLKISYNSTTAAESLLEEIGDVAFNCSSVDDCAFLSDLTRLKKIGTGAFSFTDFTTLTLPASLETLGEEAFQAIWPLKEVTFQEGCKVTEFPRALFGAYITDTTSPIPVENNVIYPCYNLKKIQFPEGLLSIGRGCFSYCINLKTGGYTGKMIEGEVNFPTGLDAIGAYAFSHCAAYSPTGEPKFAALIPVSNTGVEKIFVPDSVTEIGTAAFEECYYLNTLSIGKGVTKIPARMCYNCGEYPYENGKRVLETEQLKVSGSVVASQPEYTSENYEPLAFYGLKTLKLSDNVQKIESSAFENCYALTLDASNGWLPTELTEIGSNAFKKCKSLTKVVFGSKLISIGISAFEETAQQIEEIPANPINASDRIKHQYYGLEEIDFTYATSLENIGAGAFKNTNITSIVFPEGVTALPSEVCSGSYNLKTVETGKSLTNVGKNAFMNCFRLITVTIPYSAVLEKDAFSKHAANDTMKLTLVPKISKEKADVIIGRDTELELKCLKKFSGTAFSISDGQKDASGNFYDLLNDDVNAKVLASMSGNQINLYGKELGETAIKVSGRVDLHDQDANYGKVSFTVSYDYDVNVTQLPIKTLDLTANTLETVGSEKIIYVSMANTAGIAVNGAYAPGNTTDALTWSIDNPAVATVSEPTVTGTDEKKVTKVQVKPVALGETRLTLSSPSKTETCIIKVRVPANSVSINASTSTANPLLLAEDGTYQITASMNYANQYKDIPAEYKDSCVFVSQNEDVVTVDRDTGYVRAVGTGTAVVEVRSMTTGVVLSRVFFDIQNDTPITSLRMTANGMENEGGTNVMNMSITATAGKSFAAEYMPIKTTDHITWSINNGDVVSLSSTNPAMNNGKSTVVIKPLSAGDTILKAKSNDLEETCIIRVRVPASGLKFARNSDIVATGSMYPLVTTITYASQYTSMAATYPDSCVYTSNNTAVATVDMNTGMIHAVSAGTAKITAKCPISGRTATFTITVKDGYMPPITSFTLSSTKLELDKGKQATLSVNIKPDNADKNVTWTSSNTKVATVNGGVVKAVAVGQTTITATGSNNRKVSCNVTVKSPAKGLKIKDSTGNTKKVYMKKGTSLSLGKYMTNIDCTDTFKFTAKKNKVGTVSTAGVVTAKKPGKFTVNLTSYSGTTKKASAKITIYVVKKQTKAKKVKISGKKSIKIGQRICLTAKQTPTKATTTVTWTSNKPKLATVDRCGIVTGIKKGTVKITAKTSNGKKKTIKIKVKK